MVYIALIPIFLMDEEFSVLVDHPERGCVVCHKPKCVKEKQYGLASLLYIQCTCCKELTIVPTGKRHNIGANVQGPFDVNTKLGVVNVCI